MESSPQSSTQFERHLAHIVNNYPAARFAIVPTQSQKIRAAGFVDKNGEEYGALNVEAPYIQKRVRRYGAKMALALHWQERRKPLPSQGKVAVLWFTNAQAIERSVPQHLLDLLPDRKTLRQGQKEVGDWFEYSSGPASDTDATAHWAAFGDALLFMMFAGTTLDFGPVDPSELFSPGFLRE